MTDQAQRTDWALQQFAGFVENWTAPATLEPRRHDYTVVAKAIRAIAPPTSNNVVGYAVLAKRPAPCTQHGYNTRPSAQCSRSWCKRRTHSNTAKTGNARS